jgi:Bacterial Ig-like domain/Fibronectin type III domain
MRKFILAALFVSSLIACNPGTPTGTSSPPDPSTPPPVIDPIPSEPDPSAPDTTAPTITLSQPESNDAAINSSILVNFSEPMKSETVSVTLEPNVALSAGEWKSEEAIEFVPTTDFAPETTYKVNVTGKDVAGNLLAGSSTYQFKTSKLKDTIAPSTPQGLNAVSEEEQVKLSWKANTESDLKGYTIQYGTDANNLSSKTFVGKPGSSKTIKKLTGDTTYYFALVAEDRSGNKSKRSGTVNAKPKTVPAAKLISSVPAKGTLEVGTGLEVISFSFGKAIKRDSFKIKCSPPVGNDCDLKVASLLGVGVWTDGDKTVTFKPTRTLEQRNEYVWLLEAQDKMGKAIEKTVMSFTTAAAPVALRYTPPQTARGIPDGAYISVVFSKPMNMESLKAAFSGSVNSRDGTQTRALQISRVEAFTSSQGGFGYSFVPSEKYGDGTIVTWYVAPTAMDAGGSRLLQAVADGFSVMQRLTITVPTNPKLTQTVVRECLFTCNNVLPTNISDTVLVAGYYGYYSFQTYVHRGFFGFSLDGVLPENATITKATMNFLQTTIDGDPFAANQLGPLSLERMDYGPKLDANDFDLKALGCAAGCGFAFLGPPNAVDGQVNVLNYVQTDWVERSVRGYRSEFRLRFANNKPPKAKDDQRIYYSLPTLTIEFLVP